MSNHLLVQLQRQHILLSYFKTLSVGPVWGPNPRPPAQQTGALPTELTRRRLNVLCLEFSQTTCLVLRITEKFETRNTKSLHNKQHIHIYVRVNDQTMVLATPFLLTFLTPDVVSTTQCIKMKLMGDLRWWIFLGNTTQNEQCLIPL